MLLSHSEIKNLVHNGVIEHARESCINAASLDIHLGIKLLVEDRASSGAVVSYAAREPLKFREVMMGTSGFVLEPGQFVLAHSIEVFHLPHDVSAEYKLKSSMARIGLEHLNAGWCDAGWHGSVLTLELKNMTQHHAIQIRPGDAIGQIVFFRHAPVEYNASYASRGRYNCDLSATTIKS